jgi:hypothetical protein
MFFLPAFFDPPYAVTPAEMRKFGTVLFGPAQMQLPTSKKRCQII